MNLVQPALRRPLTIIVLIVSVVLASVGALRQMPRDIFPTLGIPTIYVAQPFGGMDPAQMEGYLTYYYEYHFLYITGIEHVESKSIQGASIIKLQFYPGTDMAQAMSETVAYVNRSRAFMPPGTVPPFIMRFDAGSVPVGNLVFSSETRSVAEMQDAALNLVRPLFATLPGVSAPPPFGGSARSIVVNVKPNRLRAYNMSLDEIVAALTAANTISPSGNMPIGKKYPMVPLNSVVKNIKDLESVPIRTGGYPAVFLRDLATVQDASDIVTCYALVNGRRTVYVPVTKRADASTLSVVNSVKENLPRFQSVVPGDVKVSYEFDQSPYVTRAIAGLTMEGALGALLTGVVILLFLRDWRSALVVVLNIPLALLAAVLALWISGQTINIMTLGGLALAIGILVDMSTVAIENIHTHLAQGKPIARSVTDSGKEVALPLLVAMLCVLAVFVPSFFMEGAAKAMFIPLSLAVGFSMVASYLLASTFVPVISTWIVRAHPKDEVEHTTKSRLSFSGFQKSYKTALQRVVHFRWLVVGTYLVAAGFVIVLIGRQIGTEIFPRVEAGELQLRLRAPTGTHVTGTEAIALEALDIIKQEAGAENVAITLGFVGVHAPSYPINLLYLWNGGSEEGVLQVQLKRGAPVKIEPLKERLRKKFAEHLPEVSFSFEPSDIVSRVMSLGASTPIEVAVSGPNLVANREFAEKVKERLLRIPLLRDVQFGQALDYPTVDVTVNRERAGIMGVKMSEVSRSLVAATSSSRFVVPNYWADPNSGVAYQIQVQVPQTLMNSMEEAQNLPVSYRDGKAILLRNIASLKEGTTIGQYERYNMQRMVTVTANITDTDLGSVTRQVTKALKEVGVPPPKVSLALRGQVVPMQQMFNGLQMGLLLAVVIIFLLLMANFESVTLALIVVSTVPAVIAGVTLSLWLTHTTLNIQSFMGAIMAIGVAVANAILLVTFAERSRMSGAAATESAVEGAQSRLRPILMTSLAMIAGMIPMALGLGEGAEQTAPLGCAVVGGLAAATIATLIFLPSVFAILRGRASAHSVSLDPDDPMSSHYVPRFGSDAATLTLFVLALAGQVTMSGCKRSSAEPAKVFSEPPVGVRVVQPTRGAISRSVTLPGEIKAFQQATLYAKIAGYLKTIHVDKGDSVKQGDLLAEIEAPELIADAAKFKADLDLAELEFKRTSDAQQKAPDLVVAQSVDTAKGRFLVAKANLERAETLLSFTKIVAPFSGTVTRRYVDVGAFIPAATSGSSPQTSALLTLADLNKVRLQVAVPENEVKFVNKDMRIVFTVDALPGKNLETKVSRISFALDEATKTMLAEADVENPGRDLRPGMYASAKLFVETKPDAVLLPADAVLVERAKTSVFVVEAGKAKKLPLKTGFFDGVAFELIDGLPANTPVIQLGKQTLNDGQPVQVTQ